MYSFAAVISGEGLNAQGLPTKQTVIYYIIIAVGQ
jgi:hypothetical protein